MITIEWIMQKLSKGIPSRPIWQAVSKGPASLSRMVYKIETVEVEGTYIKERNQHGEERYWITEPGKKPFLGNNFTITETPINP